MITTVHVMVASSRPKATTHNEVTNSSHCMALSLRKIINRRGV